MTTVFEIKKNGQWTQVRATSIGALNKWAKSNGVTDWRMVGMMSRFELVESQSLEVVA